METTQQSQPTAAHAAPVQPIHQQTTVVMHRQSGGGLAGFIIGIFKVLIYVLFFGFVVSGFISGGTYAGMLTGRMSTQFDWVGATAGGIGGLITGAFICGLSLAILDIRDQLKQQNSLPR